MLPARPADLGFLLPMPPGSNHRLAPVMVRGSLRLILTSEARRWLAAARDEVFFLRHGRFISNLAAARVALSPSNYDADAPIKLLFDALEQGGAVTKDRNIRPYCVMDDPQTREGWIAVDLWDTGIEAPKRRLPRATTPAALRRTFGKRRG